MVDNVPYLMKVRKRIVGLLVVYLFREDGFVQR